MRLKLAFLQLHAGNDLDAQLRIGQEACKKAKALGAELALFPEMWSCGYTLPQDVDVLEHLAVCADGDFVQSFGKLAQELGMAVAVTFLEKHEPKPRNSCVLFDCCGTEVLRYAKVHTCAFDAERVLCPGGKFVAADLNTGSGTVRVGCMICFDREFPESARILMLRGTELILVPNACPLEINRLAALRTRAYENMLAVAVCNYPGGHPDCNGHSALFDGVAWLPGDAGSRDMCVFEAGEDAGVYIAEFDVDVLRNYRRGEVMGNAYRRPEVYGELGLPERNKAQAYRRML